MLKNPFFMKKTRPKPRLKPWLIAASSVLLALGSMHQAAAQTCDPNNAENLLVSSFHQTVTQAQDGQWWGWGQQLQDDNPALVPVELKENGSLFVGLNNVLMATTGSRSTSHQTVALTPDGLFVWGNRGRVVPTGLTPTTNNRAQKVNVGDNGLPSGVVPDDVKQIFASNQTLALVTKGGALYVLSSLEGGYLANGSSAADATQWHQVETASGALTGVVAVRGQVNNKDQGALMALTSDNKLWTWGPSAYLGDGSAAGQKLHATEMTPPTGATGVPKMIGVTGNKTGNTYFVLYDSGQLYGMGLNSNRQVGDWTTTERRVWVPVRKPSDTNPPVAGDPFDDVRFISVQEHNGDANDLAAALLITNDGQLYNWGHNDSQNMLARGSGSHNPGMPSIPEASSAVTAEMGGHTMVFLPKNQLKLCYAGHKIAGSMGDGDSSSGATITCMDTPALNFCVPLADEPSITIAKSLQNGPPPYGLGDTIEYQFMVKNTGKVTLTDIVINDPKLGGSLDLASVTWPGGTPGELAPGETIIATGTYGPLTEADLDHPTVDNTATVTGTDPSDPDNPVSADDSLKTPVKRPRVSVNKTAVPAHGAQVSPGDTIAYTVVVNVQDIRLSSVFAFSDQLSDNLVGPVNVTTSRSELSCTPDTATRSISCTLQEGSGARSYTLKYEATVAADATTDMNNQVVVDPDQTGGDNRDPDSDICRTCSTTHVPMDVDMQATIDDIDSPNAYPGEDVTVAFTCTNNGPGSAVAPTCELAVDGVDPSDMVVTCTPDPATDPLPMDEALSCEATFPMPVTGGDVTATAGTDSPDSEPLNDTDVTPLAPTPTAIAADNDAYGPFDSSTGGTTGSVLANDMLNGSPVDPADVDLTPGTASDPGLTMNPDGTINVAVGTPPGEHTYTYTICSKVDPTACATATATVTVVSIDADDDSFGPVNSATGGDTPPVTDNDTANGDPAVPGPGGNVTLTPGAPTDPSGDPTDKLTMDPDTGIITVAPGTPPGVYEYPYTICHADDPSVCADAVVTVRVGSATVAPIPTLGQWSMLLLMSLLAGLGTMRLRRQGQGL